MQEKTKSIKSKNTRDSIARTNTAIRDSFSLGQIQLNQAKGGPQEKENWIMSYHGKIYSLMT